jgi:hypothetical protein
MNAVEAQLVKDLAHLVVDQELSKVVAALEAKLPASMQMLAAGIVAAAMPEVIKFLDAEIDKLGA